MKWVVGLLVALVLAMPIANAAEVETQTKTISAASLEFKRLGEAFDNFVFKLRSLLAFKNEAKLELLKERNAEMNSRQQAWLELKAEALEQFKSGNLTAEEKQEIINHIQAEHKSIIKEHLRLTSQIKDIQLNAKVKGDTELENEAEMMTEDMEDSKLSIGLNISGELNGPLLTIESKNKVNITAEEAKEIVEADLGFVAADVKTQTEGNTTFYVVTGSETKEAGAYMLTKNFEVWVQANTGIITNVKLGTDIEATTKTKSSIGIGVG